MICLLVSLPSTSVVLHGFLVFSKTFDLITVDNIVTFCLGPVEFCGMPVCDLLRSCRILRNACMRQKSVGKSPATLNMLPAGAKSE